MYTKIDQLVWCDARFDVMSDDAKLLFFYVLTNRHRNILGYYLLPESYASFDLHWNPQRLNEGLMELCQNGLINYVSETSMILIKDFLCLNPLDNQNQVKAAISALSRIPPKCEDRDLLELIGRLNKPFHEPLVKLLEKRLSKQILKQEEEKEKEKELTEIPPYEEIVELYGQLCPQLAKVVQLTTKRKEAINKQWQQFDQDISLFKKLFEKAGSSSFLMGKNEKKWCADFDWLMVNDNATKVLENKYKNRDIENKIVDRFVDMTKLREIRGW